MYRTHHARCLHFLDHARGAVVADLEAALDVGDRRLARFRHDGHGLIVKRVGTITGGGNRFQPGYRSLAGFRLAGDFLNIIGLTLLLEVFNDIVDFMIVHKGAMDTFHHAGAGWQVEHVAVAEQLIRTRLVEDGARIHF